MGVPGDSAVTASRSADPAEETFHRFRHLMEPLGITRLANVTGLDWVGIPVYLAIRPAARSLAVSVGKGTSRAAARTGALMESIETWHAEQAQPHGVRASTAAMRDSRRPVVDLDALPPALDESRPRAVDTETVIEWTPGTDLLTGARVWVPLDVVSLDFTRTPQTGVARNSNGLASGAGRTGALLHGLCEVIERDAEARWRAGPDERPVDLATVDDPVAADVLTRLADAGLTTAAWDVTSAVGIPCFGCVVLADPDTEPWYPAGVHDGFACHPSPGRALAGALLEATQKRLTYISGSRDDIGRAEMARATAPDLHAAVWAEVAAGPGAAGVPFAAVADRSAGSDATDLDTVVAALRAAGAERVIAVDLSSPYGVPVVKTIVPGFDGPYGACRPLERR